MRLRLMPFLVLGLLMLATADRPAAGQFEKGARIPRPAAVSAPVSTASSFSDPVLADEAQLRAAGLPTDGAGLLTFLQLRSEGEAAPNRLAALVAKLESADASERARTCAELIGRGPAAIPALRTLASDPDAPGALLARRCLRALERDSANLTGAAVRLIAARRPAGAAEALLAFLPYCEDDNVVDETRAALSAAALRNGKPEPVLLKALDDAVALRRAAAVDVLCQNGILEPRANLRKLLLDPAAAVRLRAGLALAGAYDPKAVSTLITLLTELPPMLARQAEDYLQGLAGEQSPKVPLGDDDAARARCRDAWAKWWLATEDCGPTLEEFRKRTRADADREKALALIRALGDDEFDARQKAADGLKALGGGVAPLLRQAANHPDLEVRQRAQSLLQEIEKEATAPLSPVAARLLALRKPPAAAAALLGYMPFAEDEGLVAEVQSALNAVTFRDGQPDPVVVKALEDKIAIRRGAAGEALCQGPGSREAVRKLLADADPGVRLKVGLALAATNDRAAVPVLIALTAEPTGESALAAEDYLRRLAGDGVPAAVAAVTGTDADARTKRRDAWAAWWDTQASRTQLAERLPAGNLPQRYQGYTLLIQPQNGQVMELDAAGKVRWQINGLANPQDAQVLPNDRVLITEAGGQRVTERNLKGDVLWQKAFAGGWPVGARRLPNGHTFVVARNQIVEVDRSGREVYSIARPSNDVMSAQKLRDGRIVVVSSQSQLVLLDAAGREIKSSRLQGVTNFGNDVLPKGGALVPLSWQNKVIEYDADGKVVWEATVQQPMSAFRLPNGNTLVSSQQWPPKVIELDRTGKVVGETTAATYVHKATRR